MKNLHRYPLGATFAVAVALLAACAPEPDEGDELDTPDMDRTPSVETEPMAKQAPVEGGVVMTSSFEPGEGGAEGPISGTVTVLEGEDPDGDYRLTVHIEGLSARDHAWHIHRAPCGQDGPVVVPFTETAEGPGLGQPLTPEDGMAEANVTVPRDKLSLNQLKSGEYSLHVHEKGGVDHGPSVACANL